MKGQEPEARALGHMAKTLALDMFSMTGCAPLPNAADVAQRSSELWSRCQDVPQRGSQEQSQEAKEAVKRPYYSVRTLAPLGLSSWGNRWNWTFFL